MRNLLIPVCMVLASTLYGQSKYFSGEIIYEVRVVPKSDTVDVQKIVDADHGSRSTYTIADGRYKSTYFKDGKYSYSYTYDNESKRMYDDYADRPYITFRDSRKSNAEYEEPRIFRDSTKTIKGYPSYLVESTWDSTVVKTYYSDDIRVDYSKFKEHAVGDWYNKLKLVNGAVSLESTTEYKTHYEVREVVEINRRKVKTKEFELPKKTIAASYSALDTRVNLEEPDQDHIDCYMSKVIPVSDKNGEKFESWVRFILMADGSLAFIEALEEDEYGLHNVAVDIIKNCNLPFVPGLIDDKPVNSEVYYPIEFRK